MSRTLETNLRSLRSDTKELRAKFIQTVREIAVACRPRVLIADDNLAYARLLSRALGSRGIETDIALDEGQVRFALARRDYDLVVVDGDCGRDACAGVPTIIVSGRDSHGGLRVDIGKGEGIEAIAARVNETLDAIATRVL